MYNCPHCQQSFNTFAFYCPCCQRPVGEMRVEGVMLAVWWLDVTGSPAAKWGVRTLKSGSDYLDLLEVSPRCPSIKPGGTTVTFTVKTSQSGVGASRAIERKAVEVFEELMKSDVQEWQVQ